MLKISHVYRIFIEVIMEIHIGTIVLGDFIVLGTIFWLFWLGLLEEKRNSQKIKNTSTKSIFYLCQGSFDALFLLKKQSFYKTLE